MTKLEEIQKERARLKGLFKGANPEKLQLVSGLIDQAAYLAVENAKLEGILVETGMVKVHPIHKEIQKPVEAAKQYRQNANSYAVALKALNSILNKDDLEGEDPFDEWLRSKTKPSKPKDE